MWTEQQDETLHRLFAAGASNEEIGLAVGKSPGAVATRASRSKLTAGTSRTRPRGTVKVVSRPCMCCRRMFVSEGNHNRLCDPCRDGADDYGDAYHLAA